MCLHAKYFSSKVNDGVAPSELPLFILDEVGAQTYIQSMLHAKFHNGARNCQKAFVLDNDLVEDG